MVNVDVTSIGKKKAQANSRAIWHLVWYDVTLNRDTVKYDTINYQNYDLVKEEGIWKIKSKYYEGRKKPASNF